MTSGSPPIRGSGRAAALGAGTSSEPTLSSQDVVMRPNSLFSGWGNISARSFTRNSLHLSAELQEAHGGHVGQHPRWGQARTGSHQPPQCDMGPERGHCRGLAQDTVQARHPHDPQPRGQSCWLTGPEGRPQLVRAGQGPPKASFLMCGRLCSPASSWGCPSMCVLVLIPSSHKDPSPMGSGPPR